MAISGASKMKRHVQPLLAMFACALIVPSAMAAVSAEEAKKLGGSELTIWGAEKAGNKEGTIPAYTDEKITPPAGWDFKTQGYPDPWGEKPLFSITAQNAAKYADKLDGMMDVFKKYPSFRMDVYQTHRTFAFPKYVLDNTLKNATSCRTTDKELKLQGCYAGIPFPIPKTGNEVMWSKLLGYGAYNVIGDGVATYVTPPNGVAVLQSRNLITETWPLYDPARTAVISPDENYFLARIDQTGPARGVGNKYLFYYNVNSLDIGSRAWAYIPGQRRVKLSPDLAYDTPSPISGGSSLMDEQTGFLGALDRFDFKLVGKKEKYIMSNNFKLTDARVCPEEKLANFKNFANPDCIRWELHRVWVVEATLKPGFRHVYKKRKYYFDEDGFVPGSQEGYDASGALYRLTNSVTYPFYEGGSAQSGLVELDLLTGIWTLQGVSSGKDAYRSLAKSPVKSFYTPEDLAAQGIR